MSKDRKLLFRAACTTKNFYLQPAPPGHLNWHVRFTPPAEVRKRLGIKRVFCSTGCGGSSPDSIAAAKRIAAGIVEAHWIDGGRKAEEMRVRKPMATVGEVMERYRAGARSVPDKEELDRSTIAGNVGALRRILQTSNIEHRTSNIEALGLDLVCPAETLEAFKRNWLAGIDSENPQAMRSARQTVNSYIRQARSIFGTEYLPLYKDLRLPELAGFRAVKLFKIKRGSTRYVPIAQGVIDAMAAEVDQLRIAETGNRIDGELTETALQARSMYLGFYMMLWLGMRSEEVCEARLEWIEPWPTGAKMAIVTRSYFRPKGIEECVAMAPRLLADITELSGATAPGDYLLTAPNETVRANWIKRDLSALVRRHLGADRRKTCHELRKHAISMMLMRTRSYVDTLKFSRHSDVRTLQNHYGSFLDELAPITSSNWRDAA